MAGLKGSRVSVMKTTSKIVRFHELGDADVLKIEDLPLKEPKPDEVRIDVEAIGLCGV